MLLNRSYNFADQVWFQKNRIPLRLLCNIPLTREWFRDKLNLNPSFANYPVRSITQNAIHYQVEKGVVVAEIFSGNRNEWALKREFESLLRKFHKFDIRIANQYCPALNLGYDTLTQFSDTADGYIYASSNTWATVRSATSGSVAAQSDYSANAIAAQYTSSTIYIDRAFFYFDTSSIATDKTVTSAIMSLYRATNHESYICAMKGTQANPYVAGDFDAFSGSIYGTMTLSSSSYNALSFNTTGIADIVKGTGGVTKVCCREYDHDYLDVSCDTSMFRSGCYFSNYTGTSRDPKLVVEYSTPPAASGGNSFFFGVNF